jgi:putative ABC transport system permease protein
VILLAASPTIPVSDLDIAMAALLLLVHGGLSVALGLGVGKQVLIAAVRMVVQLALVGAVLVELFDRVSPWWTGLTALAMILFAGREISARQERRLAGFWSYGIGTSAMLFAAFSVTIFALTTAVRPDPWYDPRYAIPMLGMVLGNTLTGISLGLHALTMGLVRQRPAVEARLCLGATRWEATHTVVSDALRTGLMPIVNSMAATGLVALPGMMTGQILAGAEPFMAVRYQMLIMFLIAGGTALGATAAVFAGVLRLTDERHRLRLDRLGAAR